MNKSSLACLLLWLGLAAHGEAQTFALPAVADTYLRSGSSNQNQGNDTFLRVQSSGNNRSLVRFDSAAITAAVGNGSLASARLELYIQSNSNNWSADGRTVDAHRLMANWSELGATWNCGVDSNPGNSNADCTTQWAGGQLAEEPSDTVLHTNGLTGWVRFDVTSDVLAFLSGTPNYGWIVKKTEEGQNGQVEYTSRQGAADHAPRLVLVVESPSFDEVPPSLAMTAPTRNILVNEPSPTVTVTYSDGGSGIDPASFQLLIDGQDATASCTTGTQSASCHPSGLAAGNHTLQAQVHDHAGNSAQSSFSFQLLLGPGPHLVTFQAVGDTYLRKGSSNQNQGVEPILRVQQSGTNRSLVQFDSQSLASTLSGATLVSASLELHVESNGRNWGTQGRTVDVHRLTAPWTETGATWSCPADSNTTNQQADCTTQWAGGSFAPTATASVLHTKDLAGWVSFNVTADVSAFLSGTPSYGWLLKKTDETKSGRMDYDSRQGTAGEGPRLVVVFTTAGGGDTTPPTVTITAPQPGGYLSQVTPLIAASFSEAGSGLDLASAHVTIDGNEVASKLATTDAGIVVVLLNAPSDGPHNLTVSVRDRAGNEGRGSVAFIQDSTSPVIAITAPASETITGNPRPQLTATLSDVTAGVDASSAAVLVDDVDIKSTCTELGRAHV